MHNRICLQLTIPCSRTMFCISDSIFPNGSTLHHEEMYYWDSGIPFISVRRLRSDPDAPNIWPFRNRGDSDSGCRSDGRAGSRFLICIRYILLNKNSFFQRLGRRYRKQDCLFSKTELADRYPGVSTFPASALCGIEFKSSPCYNPAAEKKPPLRKRMSLSENIKTSRSLSN